MSNRRDGADPLRGAPWSLANSSFDVTITDIPLGDRDAAIQEVISELKRGLPVRLGYAPTFRREVTDEDGEKPFKPRGDMTWYLPPELGGCTYQQLWDAFGSKRGHAVLIVGYSIRGTEEDPDLIESYFVLQDNHGKTAGYRSFKAMNFAFFKYRASSLKKLRLVHPCDSVACQP